MASQARPVRRYGTRALPPYRHVPGKTPHPTRHPDGHRFKTPPETLDSFDPKRWRTSEAYLFGIDLFNSGYYWEAHEVWEGLWVACGRRGPAAMVLKALIGLAAAGVKASVGNRRGVAAHARRAAGLFGKAAAVQVQRCMGFDLRQLAESARALAEGAASTEANVFDLVLRPR